MKYEILTNTQILGTPITPWVDHETYMYLPLNKLLSVLVTASHLC